MEKFNSLEEQSQYLTPYAQMVLDSLKLPESISGVSPYDTHGKFSQEVVGYIGLMAMLQIHVLAVGLASNEVPGKEFGVEIKKLNKYIKGRTGAIKKQTVPDQPLTNPAFFERKQAAMMAKIIAERSKDEEKPPNTADLSRDESQFIDFRIQNEVMQAFLVSLNAEGMNAGLLISYIVDAIKGSMKRYQDILTIADFIHPLYPTNKKRKSYPRISLVGANMISEQIDSTIPLGKLIESARQFIRMGMTPEQAWTDILMSPVQSLIDSLGYISDESFIYGIIMPTRQRTQRFFVIPNEERDLVSSHSHSSG